MVTQCNNSKQKRRTSPQITFRHHSKKNKKTKNKIFANGGKKYKKNIFLHDIKNVF